MRFRSGVALCVAATGVIACVAAAADQSSLQQQFDAAQAQFQHGREAEHLHRNTEEAKKSFSAALDGYRAVVAGDPAGPLAPRAQYLSGSALLFLDRPKEAVEAYQQVITRYASNRDYLAKAMVRKASVEKNNLEPDAGRRSFEQFHKEFPDGGPADHTEVERLERAFRLIGQPAPTLQTTGWIGTEPKHPDSFKGQVTMLYFFATWCPNCLKEADFIEDLHTRFGQRGLEIIAVTNHSRGQTDATVEAYVKEHGWKFPVAVDKDGKTTTAFEGGSIPTAVLIDKKGTIRWYDHPAALDDAPLEALLAEGKAHGK